MEPKNENQEVTRELLDGVLMMLCHGAPVPEHCIGSDSAKVQLAVRELVALGLAERQTIGRNSFVVLTDKGADAQLRAEMREAFRRLLLVDKTLERACENVRVLQEKIAALEAATSRPGILARMRAKVAHRLACWGRALNEEAFEKEAAKWRSPT